jgi:hypothetical protein
VFAATLADEDDRPFRRDLTCITAGMVVGGGLGALLGVLARPAALLLTAAGALAGGIVGRWISFHVSSDEWDPPPVHRSWVGANSPDDDWDG